ncbi:g4709 [Coccomyxa viridis]|uniref:G4709 protein n=1 Tax=Coccomyxa viridis TaxID=1274662 RepID=A0ABP1FXV8_9CHLO
MRMSKQVLVFALICALAAHGAVEASRMGSVRKLNQVSGGIGGCYAWNGSGIVVVNTVVYVNAVVVVDTGNYGDGTVVYLEGGIEFGIIYGGIIYPPNNAQYYPTAIVNVVVFGPVFAQSWFYGPTRVICWSMTIFYRPGGVRIYNPAGYSGPFYNQAGVQLGNFDNSVARINDNTIIQQNNVVINTSPPPKRDVTPPSAAGKSPISSAIGQAGVTVSPGAAPGGSPGANRSPGADRSPGVSRSPGESPRGDNSPGTSPDRSRSPGDNRSPGASTSPDANRRSGSPPNNSPSAGRSPDQGRSPEQNRGNGSPAPSGNGGNGGGRRDANGSPDPSDNGNGGGIGSGGGGIGGGGGGGGGDAGGGGGGDRRDRG